MNYVSMESDTALIAPDGYQGYKNGDNRGN